MLRLSIVVLSAFILAAAGHRSAQRPGGPAAVRDTVQAGDAVVDAARLKPFALLRELTLTRGTRSSRSAASPSSLRATHWTAAVLLDVLTFETPNATTVDSSWIDARTLRPLRMRSSNAARVVSLEFEGQRVRGDHAQLRCAHAAGPAPRGPALRVEHVRPRAVGPAPRGRVPGDDAGLHGPLRARRLVRGRGRAGHQHHTGERASRSDVGGSGPGDSVAPSARFWVSQRHRFVDQVLVWEPGVSIMYQRP